jgi:putative ABC transport system permease protein
MLNDFLLRLRSLFRRKTVETELEEELRFHFDKQVSKFIQSGMAADEAKRRARLEFGGMEQLKEEHRDARGLSLIETLLQDLRYAMRQLLKSPGFATAAVLTLGLGIAVNATMFSLVSGFLLARPPGREPERVTVVTSVNPAGGFQPDAFPVSAPNYFAWRQANHVFANIAAADEYRTVSLTPQGHSAEESQPEALRSAAVSPNYFDVLGVSPQLGRTFSDGEDQPGHEHVAILSHELWERHFGSDASRIGHAIRLNRESYTVIGVMPASFSLLGFTPQLWTPLALTAADQTAAARKDRSLFLFARLKPGITLEEARAQMVTLATRAGDMFPETEKGWGVAVRTLPDFLVYNFGIRQGLAMLMTTVAFVLLIACANVAGLLLARASGRRKELAIRIALGAGRLRIVLQLLSEGLVIAVLGGTMGLLLSFWGIKFVRANMDFNEAMSAVPLSLDWNVLLFALAISLLCAVLCGLAPALNASRTDVNMNLKDESRAASPSRSLGRLRTVLVTGEIALALFLLIGTGLLLRWIFLVEHQNLGFQPDHLLTAGLTLDYARYKDASQKSLFVQEVIPRLQQMAGVEAVAVTSDLPSSGPGSVTLQIQGQLELPANQRLRALNVLVSADYFRTAGIPLLRGRTFTETDNAKSPGVVVVNQEFVHRYLQDQDPLGKQIRLDVTSSTPEWSQIVGVVANVKSYSEDTRDDPEVYEQFSQRPVNSFSLMVRTSSDSNSLASALRNTVAQVDAELPLARVMSMPDVIERQKNGNPFFVTVLVSFALLALILSAIGIYGLIAYSVGQRTHEIGIRMALGAKSPDVVKMVLWEGLKMTAIGASIGLALALPLPKIFAAMFYGSRLAAPLVYFIVPAAVVAVAMLATYLPARRATRVDPMVALRYQ